MRRKIFLFYFIIFPLFLYAQNEAVLIPPNVFVGDTARISYSFGSAYPLIGEGEVLHAQKKQIEDFFLKDEYTIKSIELSQSQKDVNIYNIKVDFIPWKTGIVDLEACDIFDLFLLTPFIDAPLMIDIPAVTIQSFVEKSGKNKLQSPYGPSIIPGSSWIIYIFVAVIVFFLFIVTYFLFHLKKIMEWLSDLCFKIVISKNYKNVCKKLQRLKKDNSLNAKDFATMLSLLIRDYLSKRFDDGFYAVETSSLYSHFMDLTGGTTSCHAQDAIESLYEVCVRLDFLRFSGDRESVSLFDNAEKKAILDKTTTAFLCFEKPRDEEDEANDRLH